MQDYPHHYSATARAGSEGAVAVSSKGLADLETAPPAEFGGPGDRWSPETLLVGAVADCFILTFRAVARASQLEWLSLECEAVGTLERVEKVVQFSAIHVRAALRVPAGTDPDRAKRLLERAEKSCLVTNSFKAASHLEAAVEVEAEA
jgi:peroxiredoxin-like protein